MQSYSESIYPCSRSGPRPMWPGLRTRQQRCGLRFAEFHAGPLHTLRRLAPQMRGFERSLVKEQFKLQAEATKMKREADQFLAAARRAARRGDMADARANAKLVVEARKTQDRLLAGRAQLNSVCMQMKGQAALVKVAGAMRVGSQVMESLQRAMSMPAIARTAREFAMEMDKAGLLQEMATDVMDDAMDMAGEAGDISDSEVDEVVASLTGAALPSQAVGQVAEASPVAQPAGLPQPAGLTVSEVAALPSAPSTAAATSTAEASPRTAMAMGDGLPSLSAVSQEGAPAAAGAGGEASPTERSLEARLAALG